METIGFVGLGTMGAPMARRLVDAGHPVAGFDVVPSALERAATWGVRPAVSPAAAAAAADVVITMLPSSQHVEAAVTGQQGVLESLAAGTVLIDMSTIEPTVTRRIAEAAAAKGVEMIDAPVSRGQPAAMRGELSIMVGGELEVLERCRTILGVLGTDIYHLGPVGSGGVGKLVNNILIGIIAPAIAEALVFGVKSGVRLESLLEVIGGSSGDSWLLQNFFPKAFDGDFEPGFFVEHMHKDLGLASAHAAAIGVPMVLSAIARELFAMTKAKGLGHRDFTAVLLLLEELADVEVRRRGAGPRTENGREVISD